MTKCLVIGASGQLGTNLTGSLRAKYGKNQVVASDIRPTKESSQNEPFEVLDAMDFEAIKKVVEKHQINVIYHLAAILSAKGEQNPEMAWNLNMTSLLHVLNLAKENTKIQIFWPSSIAVFGPSTPKDNTPQDCVMDPNTVYGISKLAGERWCEYYHKKHGVDVRSVRYPGLIGYKTLPGGGTTDYAVDIFYKILQEESYECFLKENCYLPMMYMDDAVKATIDIMEAPVDAINIRSSYNLSAISFSPKELYNEIKNQISEAKISYNPDFRQAIADSWPNSINDAEARKDWGWEHSFDLSKMVQEIIKGLKEQLVIH
ncbi:MAG: NAD-dependent epimerase/dehydratase family protein [Cyclobacteriaceae bacterium]|nr:NAD-dependent epimerase/dehydratase family protein [Cyclobacteriaceae bacterium]